MGQRIAFYWLIPAWSSSLFLFASGQQQQLSCLNARPVLEGKDPYHRFGLHNSLSANGTIAAVGAERDTAVGGYVQIFRGGVNENWSQLGSNINGTPDEGLGTLTSPNALSDDAVLAVGSPKIGSTGASVRVFNYNGTDWDQVGPAITGPASGRIGEAVAISGDGTIVAGGAPSTSSSVGAVLVFELAGDAWAQKGSTLNGQGEERSFGDSVALSQDGSTLAVGIPDVYSFDSLGFVRVYQFANNDWNQIGQTLQGNNIGSSFGRSVSLSSNGLTLAVTAFDGGYVQVFRYDESSQEWVLRGSTISREVWGGVAISGDASLLVTAGNSFLLYQWTDDDWALIGETQADASHITVAISRDGSTAMSGGSGFDISLERCLGDASSGPNTIEQPSPALIDTILDPPPPQTIVPTTAKPTVVPTMAASPAPTDGAESTTSRPSDQLAVTMTPQATPDEGVPVQEDFSGLTLVFNGAGKLADSEKNQFQLLMKEWFENYFRERSGTRKLQRLAARDMETTILVTDQLVALSESGEFIVNTLTYDQTMMFKSSSTIVNARNYLTLPFLDVDTNEQLAATLSTGIDAFEALRSPIDAPRIPSATDPSDNGGSDSNLGVIVGAVVGAVVVIGLAGVVIVRRKKRHAPSQFPPEPRQAGASTIEAEPGANAVDTVVAEPVAAVPAVPEAQVYKPQFKDQARAVPGEENSIPIVNAIQTDSPALRDQIRSRDAPIEP